MPVYNEGKVIAETIKRVHEAIKMPFELLIVYDMDEDTTVPAVKKIQSKYTKTKPIKNIYGRGALNAIKTGFNKAKGGSKECSKY